MNRMRINLRDASGLSIGIITLSVFIVIFVAAALNPASKPALGQEFPIQGQYHIEHGSSHPAYNSNPPTSGWHYDRPANWGVHTSSLADETLVHNLEHGGIWISYNPQLLNNDDIEKLTHLTRNYKSKVVLTPRSDNVQSIALASWGRLKTLDFYNDTLIKEFIVRNQNKGPEQIPDM